MKVSVVTISFNQRKYLERCIQSVKSQAGEYEHIVVDAGSTDGSREYLQSVLPDDRLKLVFEPDSGPAQGLNHGLNRVTGDIVLYLNSDDEFAPGAFEVVRAAHRLNPESSIIVNDGWLIDENSRPVRYFRSSRLTALRAALNVAVVLQQSTSFLSSALIGRYWFDEGNRLDWDGELVWRMLGNGERISYGRGVVGYFRLQPDSITSSVTLQATLRESHTRRRRSYAGALRPFEVISLPVRALRRFVVTISTASKRFPGSVQG